MPVATRRRNSVSRQKRAVDADREEPQRRAVYRRWPKPPYTYKGLIATAIMIEEEAQASLATIYLRFKEWFPFFMSGYKGWTDSVRHMLSNHDCFIKVLRIPTHVTGKSNFWAVDVSKIPARFLTRQNSDEEYAPHLHEHLGIPSIWALSKMTCKDRSTATLYLTSCQSTSSACTRGKANGKKTPKNPQTERSKSKGRRSVISRYDGIDQRRRCDVKLEPHTYFTPRQGVPTPSDTISFQESESTQIQIYVAASNLQDLCDVTPPRGENLQIAVHCLHETVETPAGIFQNEIHDYGSVSVLPPVVSMGTNSVIKEQVPECEIPEDTKTYTNLVCQLENMFVPWEVEEHLPESEVPEGTATYTNLDCKPENMSVPWEVEEHLPKCEVPEGTATYTNLDCQPENVSRPLEISNYPYVHLIMAMGFDPHTQGLEILAEVACSSPPLPT